MDGRCHVAAKPTARTTSASPSRSKGPLRIESLRAALDQVVARHDALRVVIAPDGASQTIRPPFSVELPLTDLSDLDPDGARA